MESLITHTSLRGYGRHLLRPQQVTLGKGEDERVARGRAGAVRSVPGAADHVVLGIPLPFGPGRHRLADVAGSVELSDDQLRRTGCRIAGFRMDARGDPVQDLQVLVLCELVERAAQVLP